MLQRSTGWTGKNCWNGSKKYQATLSFLLITSSGFRKAFLKKQWLREVLQVIHGNHTSFPRTQSQILWSVQSLRSWCKMEVYGFLLFHCLGYNLLKNRTDRHTYLRTFLRGTIRVTRKNELNTSPANAIDVTMSKLSSEWYYDSSVTYFVFGTRLITFTRTFLAVGGIMETITCKLLELLHGK